jgi:hypothetical protein
LSRKAGQYVGGTGVDNRDKFAVSGNTQHVVVGPASAEQAANLHVQGNLVVTSGQAMFPSGTYAAPGITFLANPGHGFLYNSSTEFYASVNGAERFVFSTTAITTASGNGVYGLGSASLHWNSLYSLVNYTANGTVTAPAYTFTGDINSGMYMVDFDSIGFATGGVARLLISNSIANVNGNFSFEGTLDLGSIITKSNLKLKSANSSASANYVGPAGEMLYNSSNNTIRLQDGSTVGGFIFGAGGGSSYTDEAAQDAVGAMIGNTSSVGLSYVDGTPLLYANVLPGGVTYDMMQKIGHFVPSLNAAYNLGTSASNIWANVFSNSYVAGIGSTTELSFRFQNDVNTGFYRPFEDGIRFRTGGQDVIDLGDGLVDPITNAYIELGTSASLVYHRIRVGNVWAGGGAAIEPAYTFYTDTNTGLYNNAADVIGIVTGGIPRVNISSTEIAPAQNAAYDFGIASTKIWANVYANTYVAGPGSTGAMSFRFQGDTTTGFYSPTSGTIRIRATNQPVIDFSDSVVNPAANASVVLGNDNSLVWAWIRAREVMGGGGSPGTPALSFYTDTNTGLYNNAADTIGVATGGIPRVNFTSSAIAPTETNITTLGTSSSNMFRRLYVGNVWAGDGSAAAPSFTFAGYEVAGFYLVSASNGAFGYAIDSTEKLSIHPNRSIFNHGVTTTVTTLTDALLVDWNLHLGNRFLVQFGNSTARTLQAPNGIFPGQSFEITIKSGGGTLAYNSYFKFKDATAPSLGANTNLLFGTCINAEFIAASLVADIR